MGEIQSPQLSQSPTTAPPKIPSLIVPDCYRDPFDVLKDLFDNIDGYKGDKVIKLSRCPGYLEANFRSYHEALIKAHGRPIPVGANYSMVVTKGMLTLKTTPEIREYLELRREATRESPLIPSMKQQTRLHKYLGSLRKPAWEFTVSCPCGEYEPQVTFKTSEDVQGQLYAFAGELGLNASTIGILSLGIGLADQPNIHPEVEPTVKADVDRFTKEIAERTSELAKLVRFLTA